MAVALGLSRDAPLIPAPELAVPSLATFLFFTLLGLSVDLSTGFLARPAPLAFTAGCAAGRPGAPRAPDILAVGLGAPSELAALLLTSHGRSRRLLVIPAVEREVQALVREGLAAVVFDQVFGMQLWTRSSLPVTNVALLTIDCRVFNSVHLL